jgi:hypothetical protein
VVAEIATRKAETVAVAETILKRPGFRASYLINASGVKGVFLSVGFYLSTIPIPPVSGDIYICIKHQCFMHFFLCALTHILVTYHLSLVFIRLISSGSGISTTLVIQEL